MAETTIPFSDVELENFQLRIGQTRRVMRRLESSSMEAIKAFGGTLFKAVFQDEILNTLHNSLDECNRQGKGLRIRLRMNNAPALVNLPWEYLYNPYLNRFLSLSTSTPLVRYLELPEQITPLAMDLPLRVLVVISNPSDFPELDVDREWNNLKTALGDMEKRGILVLERLETTTPIALQYMLRRNEYHIFHFIGHGGFDEQAQDGILLFEDDQGHGHKLSGEYLGTLLHDERTLRLVVLNACEGAKTGNKDLFAGVAQSLVQQGLTAVIAMQNEITDEAAITFAREFYTAIIDGYPVDAAVSEARKAIFSMGNDTEWGTPVLYMRAPDGQVFSITKTSPSMEAPSIAQPEPAKVKTVSVKDAPWNKPDASVKLNPPTNQVAQNTFTAPYQPVTLTPQAVKTRTRRLVISPKLWTFLLAGGGLVVLALLGLAARNLFFLPPHLASYSGMVQVDTELYKADAGDPATLPVFWIDRYETTNAMYAQFLQKSKGTPPSYWINGKYPAGQGDFPVHQITWEQANRYCAALGKRLPTKAEWEFAARGPFGWQFPWGNEAYSVKQELDGTLPVNGNSANRSYFGVYYMSGNVGEWVSNAYKPGNTADHMLLGGSFGTRDSLATISHGTDQDLVVGNAGIRCAADNNDALAKSFQDDALALYDNFDSNATNWPKIGQKGDKFIFNYHDPDYYHLEDRLPNTFIPAFYDPVTFHNFVLETEAFVDAKNTDNQQGNFFYGPVVKQGDDVFYGFVVSAKTHEWQVVEGKLLKDAQIGATSDLKVLKSGRQDEILGASEDKEDRLVVIANGSELLYFINGNLATRVAVDDYAERKVGFLAVTMADITRIHIHFNWVSVQKIDPFDSGVGDQAASSSGMTMDTSSDTSMTSTAKATAEPKMDMQPTETASPTPVMPAMTSTLTTPTLEPKITLLFTGMIQTGRCVQAAIDEKGNADYLYDNVRTEIKGADLAVGILNSSVSDIPPHTGCVNTLVLVSSKNNAEAMANAGFDVLDVATHHIMNCGPGDCGDKAFVDTLANLRWVGIVPVGGGSNMMDAMQPIIMTVKGVRFAFVAQGIMMEPMANSGMDAPGIAELNEENLRAEIAAARQKADVVIVMPHWGPEDSPIPNEFQLPLAKVAVEAGANLVVGSHTHVIQAMQTIDGVPVFYGLGNFIFDQTFDLAHQQSLMIKAYFTGSHLDGYDLIVTHVDRDGTVHIAGADETAQALKDLQAVSANLKP